MSSGEHELPPLGCVNRRHLAAIMNRMTEADWLICTEPEVMLRHVRSRLSERKLRLWACACCRRDMPAHPEGRRAVEVAERYSDGHASGNDLAEAWRAASPQPVRFTAGGLAARDLARLAADRTALVAAVQDAVMEVVHRSAWIAAGDLTGSQRWSAWDTGRRAERHAQADLFREIAGNPFRTFEPPPAWPETVVLLAKSLYAGVDCAFALHDALLEVGCGELAEHFTAPRHPKGCWAMDAILEKT